MFQHGLKYSFKAENEKIRKKEFIDPSIAVAGLSVTPEMLMYDLETFGFIFENYVLGI